MIIDRSDGRILLKAERGRVLSNGKVTGREILVTSEEDIPKWIEQESEAKEQVYPTPQEDREKEDMDKTLLDLISLQNEWQEGLDKITKIVTKLSNRSY